MKLEEFSNLIKATVDRLGSSESDAFLHLVKEWAVVGNFTYIAQGAAFFVTIHPETRSFIRARIAATVANQYLPTVSGYSDMQFARWVAATPNGIEPLKKSFNDAKKLPLAVAAIVKQILGFERESTSPTTS